MKRVLVTGGAGFIGSHLTEALLARGHQVVVLDDESTGDPANLAAVLDHPRLTYVRGDAADAALTGQWMDQADEAYHLAAAVGVRLVADSPFDSIRRNIEPALAVLQAARRRAQRGEPVTVFLASSSEAYGKNPGERWAETEDLVFGPTSCARWSYGASKAIDEFLALAAWRQWRAPVVIGRLFNVVGPRQSGAYGMVLPRFVAAALRNEPLVVHDDGRQQRCFAHVLDVVDAIIRLTGRPEAAGHVVNIGGDEPVTILELAQRVIRAAGARSEIRFQSYAAAYGHHFEDVRRRVPDLRRLRTLIDYRPRFTLDDAIRDLIAAGR